MLDLGCNLGPEVRYAGMHGWTVDACDVDAEAIAELNAFLAKNRVTNVFAARFSIQEYLKRTTRQYDLVHCWNVLHQLRQSDIPEVLKGIRDVIRPGGLAILRVFTKDDPTLSRVRKREHVYLFEVGEVLQYFPDYEVVEHFAGPIQDPGHPNRPRAHQHVVEQVVIHLPY